MPVVYLGHGVAPAVAGQGELQAKPQAKETKDLVLLTVDERLVKTKEISTRNKQLKSRLQRRVTTVGEGQ